MLRRSQLCLKTHLIGAANMEMERKDVTHSEWYKALGFSQAVQIAQLFSKPPAGRHPADSHPRLTTHLVGLAGVGIGRAPTAGGPCETL